MSKFKFRTELTSQQIQLKELTEIWIDNGDEKHFKSIHNMLKPMIIHYYHKTFNDNGVFSELANDVLLNIYGNRNKWKEKQEYPNLQNYSLAVARNMMVSYIKYVNANKRKYENISSYNKDSIALDMDYDNETGDKYNYIEKFCFDNDLYDNSPETDFIISEKELAQDFLLQKCINHLIDLQKKKSQQPREQISLNIVMEYFNGMSVSDIVKKYNMPDDIKSNQYVQHIFYRYKQRLKHLYQNEYDEMVKNYYGVEAFDSVGELVD